ncbi:hypothetical protein [Secundilactobacillus folii]|uniref:Integral membrane protein n=1 Tax=Secundilactobacillus folii TaxID=2678357 RepID=A0A7X3C1Y7_9LACO|nr:hypothetical protein [Secundilactobacillus folii]MTV81267.1 hypothetical protein [Secundilactobacillus folii]
MTTILKRLGWPYWLLSLVLGIGFPIMLRNLAIGGMWRSGIIYGLLYSVIAGVLGSLVKRRGDAWWLLFVLPILFAIGVFLSGPQYAIYFAAVYLCIGYLSYGLTTKKGE